MLRSRNTNWVNKYSYWKIKTIGIDSIPLVRNINSTEISFHTIMKTPTAALTAKRNSSNGLIMAMFAVFRRTFVRWKINKRTKMLGWSKITKNLRIAKISIKRSTIIITPWSTWMCTKSISLYSNRTNTMSTIHMNIIIIINFTLSIQIEIGWESGSQMKLMSKSRFPTKTKKNNINSKVVYVLLYSVCEL